MLIKISTMVGCNNWNNKLNKYKDENIELLEKQEHDIIKKVKKIIDEECENIDKIVIKRSRKLVTSMMLSIMSSKALTRENSYMKIIYNLNKDELLSISDTAIIKRRKTLDPNCIRKIGTRILDEMQIIKPNSRRYIAVDSTKIYLNYKLKNCGFKQYKQNDKYTIGCVSALYDLTNEQLINYHLCSHQDERLALLEQIGNLRENDVVIADRGYYSEKIVATLKSKNIDIIFRRKYNAKDVTELNNSETLIYKHYLHYEKLPMVPLITHKYLVDMNEKNIIYIKKAIAKKAKQKKSIRKYNAKKKLKKDDKIIDEVICEDSKKDKSNEKINNKNINNDICKDSKKDKSNEKTNDKNINNAICKDIKKDKSNEKINGKNISNAICKNSKKDKSNEKMDDKNTNNDICKDTKKDKSNEKKNDENINNVICKVSKKDKSNEKINGKNISNDICKNSKKDKSNINNTDKIHLDLINQQEDQANIMIDCDDYSDINLSNDDEKNHDYIITEIKLVPENDNINVQIKEKMQSVYYVTTTLNELDTKHVIDVYKKRWDIETNFKYSKYYYSLGFINSKLYKFVEQDIAIHELAHIIDGVVLGLVKNRNNFKSNSKNYLETHDRVIDGKKCPSISIKENKYIMKTNFKILFTSVRDDIIPVLLMNNFDDYLSYISKIIKIISVFNIPIRDGRAFERRKICPSYGYLNK